MNIPYENGRVPSVMAYLGYAGLLPFVFIPLAYSFGWASQAWLLNVLSVYSFGIYSFMCGTWWQVDRDDVPSMGQNKVGLLLSNCMFLAGFFIFVMASDNWFISAALLFLGLLFLECYTHLVGRSSAVYKRMRLVLTSVASTSLVLMSYLMASSI